MENKDMKLFRLVFKHKKDGDMKSAIYTLDDLIFGVGNQTVVDMIGFFEEDGYKLIRKDRYTGINVKNNKPLFENDEVKVLNEVALNKIFKVVFSSGAFRLIDADNIYTSFDGMLLEDDLEVVNPVESFY